MNYFIGQIVLFGGNFAPKGFAYCAGQLLSIAQNQALFAILGTTYGGDGVTTFALPDLRGRTPFGATYGNTNNGLSAVQLGEMAGNTSVTILSMNLPMSGLRLMASPNAATTSNPQGNVLARPSFTMYGSSPNSSLAPCVKPGGGTNTPVSIQPPSLGLNYIIAITGIFPSRS